MRIEGPQHAWNGAAVNRFFGLERFREVLIHQRVNFTERANFGVLKSRFRVRGGRRDLHAGAVEASHNRTNENN